MVVRPENGPCLARSLVVLCVISWLVLTGSAHAATFNVDSTADEVDANTGDGICQTATAVCTLRAAIMQSNASGGADTINLPAGTYNLTIASASSDIDPAVGDLDLGSGGVTISGAGAGTTIVNQTMAHRVFEVPVDIFFSGSVVFEDFTIQGGDSSGLGVFNDAAGLQVGSRFASQITLRRMVVTGNTGDAAVFSKAHLLIEDSTISNNTGDGVFVTNDGSTPASNVRDLDIIASTIANNTSSGVAIENLRNGELTNSTISGNGIYGYRAQYTTGNIVITNSTLANNTGNGLAGIGYYYISSFISPDIRVRNSIVADNTAGDIRTSAVDSNAVLPTSQGYNIIGDATGNAAFNQTGDATSTDPLLGALALNAPGATKTHALGLGSPAIDTASATYAPATDQRGVSRPQGTADDKGAYEFIPPSSDVAVTKTDGAVTIDAGDPVTYTIVVSNNGPDAVSGVSVTDTLPASLSSASWTCVAAGGATCSASGTGDIDDTVSLPASGSATYTLTATLDLAATGSLVNTASAAVPLGVSDATPGNNSATDSNTIVPAPTADVAVTKTDGATSTIAGTEVTYTIVVANAGPNAVSGVTVTDNLPASLSGGSWTCVAAGGAACSASGTGDIDDSVNLPAAGSLTYTLTATLDAGATGTLENTASASLPVGTVDPNQTNNSATDSNTVIPPLVADAGPDRTTATGNPIDPDTETIVLGGMPSASGGAAPYTYAWSITPGADAVDWELSSATAESPNFTGFSEGTYTATLTVTDSNTTQAQDSALLEVVYPDQRDIYNTTLTGTQTLGACSALTAEETTFAAGSNITLMALVVEFLNGIVIEDGAVVTVINAVPPECAP